MRELNGIYMIWYRDLLRFWRNKARMVSSLGFPLLFLVVFGAGLSRTMGNLAPGVDFIKFMFPGIIGMTVLMTSVMSGMSIVWDREFGFLREVLVAPVSRGSIVLGKMLGGATMATMQGVMVLVLAPLLGLRLTPGLVLLLVPSLFLIACALAGLGIVLASRIKSMEAFQVIMQMAVMPAIFLSGVFFPVNNLPSWMNAVVKVNPVTYGVDAVRQVVLRYASTVAAGGAPGADVSYLGVTLWGHTMSLGEDLLVMAAFGTVMLVLAMWSFSRQG